MQAVSLCHPGHGMHCLEGNLQSDLVLTRWQLLEARVPLAVVQEWVSTLHHPALLFSALGGSAEDRESSLVLCTDHDSVFQESARVPHLLG